MSSPGSGRSFIEEARRAQITEAAIAIIAEVGYGKASFARIATRAGISPALISYHFGSKDHLMAEVKAHVSSSLDAAITQSVEDAPGYGPALRRMIESFVRYFGEHPAETTAMGEILRHEAVSGTAPDTGSDQRKWIDELEAMFREGQAEGEWASFNARAMAVSLLSTLQATPAELRGRSASEIEQYGSDLADIFEAATRQRRRRR